MNHALHCLTLFVVFSFFCIVPYYFRKYSIVFKINTLRWDIELWENWRSSQFKMCV